jgi:hypothetical protein
VANRFNPSSYRTMTAVRQRLPMITVEMTTSCFKYVSCDVPAGETLDEYRRRRVRPQRRGLMARLRSRARRR